MKSQKVFLEGQFGLYGVAGFKLPMHEFNCIYMNANLEPYFFCPISYEVGEVIVVWAQLEFSKRTRQDFMFCKVVSCVQLNSAVNRFKIGLQICSSRTSM